MDEYHFFGELNFKLKLYFKYEYWIESNFEYLHFLIVSCLNMNLEGIGDIVNLWLMFLGIEIILTDGAATLYVLLPYQSPNTTN